MLPTIGIQANRIRPMDGCDGHDFCAAELTSRSIARYMHPNYQKERNIMTVVNRDEAMKKTIAEGRTRYLIQTDNLMTAVIDFTDGPTDTPDPPHSHPHEQVSYVAEGEILFFLDDQQFHLKAGDVFAVPGNVPHTVQLLTEKVRLVDTFTPIREDFL
jgi:quercetin dioxygenase-like cupin family protein